MPKVYVPQVPSRIDPATRLWIPTVNIEPAKSFGEIEIMLPPAAGRLATVPLMEAMREKMKEFRKGDYVVALGDPSLIAIASCISCLKTGGFLRLLKWDRIASQYLEVEVQL